MIRGGGCGIRPAPTQSGLLLPTSLSVRPKKSYTDNTTKTRSHKPQIYKDKTSYTDNTTKNRSHKPRIYTTISPGCVILCTPGDKSVFCQKRPKLSPGCRTLWGGGFLMYGYYIVSNTVYEFEYHTIPTTLYSCSPCITQVKLLIPVPGGPYAKPKLNSGGCRKIDTWQTLTSYS